MIGQAILTELGEIVVMSRRDYDALLARAGDEDAEDRMTALLASEAPSWPRLPPQVSAFVLSGDSILRALRKSRNRTQADLSSACGVTQGYLSDLETGEKAGSPEVVAKIAFELSVDPSWFSSLTSPSVSG